MGKLQNEAVRNRIETNNAVVRFEVLVAVTMKTALHIVKLITIQYSYSPSSSYYMCCVDVNILLRNQF
jgi:type IV secretory pathway component VirB8